MKRAIRVTNGAAATPVGTLHFNAEGTRENCAFEYAPGWLRAATRFAIDPLLPLQPGPVFRKKSAAAHSSVFFGAIADTEPDGWGRRVINRATAKRRAAGSKRAPAPLTSLDYLLEVDDFSRAGALRYQDEEGNFLRAHTVSIRLAPPLIDLAYVLGASRRLEEQSETEADLRYLRGHGTSLGGLRPKCTVLDTDGSLAIGKFPSIKDERAVTKGEVLGLHLAARAGINASQARIVNVDGTPVTVVRRFDRRGKDRVPYLSAHSLLQVDDDADHAYTEIAGQIRIHGAKVKQDLHELWRRMVFSVMISNVDDHLRNHGFLHAGDGRWALSPAFDINPTPDKAMSLKTWISEESGPEASIDAALDAAKYFSLTAGEAKAIIAEVRKAVSQWRRTATAVGMTAKEADQFEAAFRHRLARP